MDNPKFSIPLPPPLDMEKINREAAEESECIYDAVNRCLRAVPRSKVAKKQSQKPSGQIELRRLDMAKINRQAAAQQFTYDAEKGFVEVKQKGKAKKSFKNDLKPQGKFEIPRLNSAVRRDRPPKKVLFPSPSLRLKRKMSSGSIGSLAKKLISPDVNKSTEKKFVGSAKKINIDMTPATKEFLHLEQQCNSTPKSLPQAIVDDNELAVYLKLIDNKVTELKKNYERDMNEITRMWKLVNEYRQSKSMTEANEKSNNNQTKSLKQNDLINNVRVLEVTSPQKTVKFMMPSDENDINFSNGCEKNTKFDSILTPVLKKYLSSLPSDVGDTIQQQRSCLKTDS